MRERVLFRMKVLLPNKTLKVQIIKYLGFLAIISLFLILLLSACGDNTITHLAEPPTVTSSSGYTPPASKMTPTIHPVTNVNSSSIMVKKETAIAEATLTKIAEPISTPTPTLATGTAFCHASDLAVTDGLQGATGALAGSIVFTNKSSNSCYLQGYLQIQIQNGDRKILPLQYSAFCSPCTDPSITNQQRKATVTAIGQEKTMLPPGRQAIAMVVWSNWCSKDKLNNLHFIVTLPNNSGKLTVPIYDAGGQTPLNIAPRCDAPDAGSSLSTSSFQYKNS